MEIWDLGHSTRTEDEFLELLKEYKTELLVDVRRFPSSKKFPHFEKTRLEELLKKKRIDYIWLGEKLGGFRKGGYREWMKTKDFAAGSKEMERKAQIKRTAFMCAEGDYTRCHRRFIIEFLERKGWKVHHIPSLSIIIRDCFSPVPAEGSFSLRFSHLTVVRRSLGMVNTS